MQNVMVAFTQWQSDTGIKLDKRGDTRVFSSTYGFAGAMDAFGWTPDNKLVAVDFKTSNGVRQRVRTYCKFKRALTI